MELHILEHSLKVASIEKDGIQVCTHGLIKLAFLASRTRWVATSDRCSLTLISRFSCCCRIELPPPDRCGSGLRCPFGLRVLPGPVSVSGVCLCVCVSLAQLRLGQTGTDVGLGSFKVSHLSFDCCRKVAVTSQTMTPPRASACTRTHTRTHTPSVRCCNTNKQPSVNCRTAAKHEEFIKSLNHWIHERHDLLIPNDKKHKIKM